LYTEFAFAHPGLSWMRVNESLLPKLSGFAYAFGEIVRYASPPMPDPISPAIADAVSPVSQLALVKGPSAPIEGIALALSGGGYRAMLFHVGVLWRMQQNGLLAKLRRVSSVSGGSIVAALLGLKWKRIVGKGAAADAFLTELVAPIRAFAHVTVDVFAVGKGALLPGTISQYVADAYAEHLYGDATLQDLPDDPPRFVINATNVQSGALWRFSKPFMGDYLVGRVRSAKVPLADAVAASSAFPPFLSPARLAGGAFKFDPPTDEPLNHPPYTTDIYLSDGGVYDNLGLETIWKRYTTLLVSDAGQKLAPDADPDRDWARHAKRILDVVDNQVRSLRKRQLIDAFVRGLRKGAYWGIRTDIEDYGVACLPCPAPRTLALAAVPTRLSDVDDATQERLINWGYAVCDAALRAHFDPQLPAAAQFPYPAAAV
jgi:NTE family protein